MSKWLMDDQDRETLMAFHQKSEELNQAFITENEAKAKICPIIQMLGPCVARRCMAWRWGDPPMRLTAAGADRLEAGMLPDKDSCVPDEGRRGYCGAFTR